METLWEIFKYPDEFYPLLKVKMAVKEAKKQIPPDIHWGFCYTMLHKVSTSFSLVIQQLDTELRNAACVFYLFLRAIDTVEDDMSIAMDVKLPILRAFHQHIYDRDWKFSCGAGDCKILMDGFHHVSTAFLELDRHCQVVIEDMIRQTGEGMAKFICREKTNIIQDYLEDINDIPSPRKFWPGEIWCKYVNQLEDLKCEENTEKAVQCLNEMVTNSLLHVEDCLNYMSAIKDHAIFRFSAIPQIMSIGTLALCYNNSQFFRGPVKMRRGLAAVIFCQTNTMSDVYGAFYDFLALMKSKVDKKDPNATKTLSKIEAIQSICKNSGTLKKRKLHIVRTKSAYSPIMMMVVFIVLAIIYARLSSNQQNN